MHPSSESLNLSPHVCVSGMSSMARGAGARQGGGATTAVDGLFETVISGLFAIILGGFFTKNTQFVTSLSFFMF